MHHDSSPTATFGVAAPQIPFAMVPKWIMPLGAKAILAYTALAAQAYGAETAVSVGGLAESVGICARSMRAGIAILVEHGAIEVVERCGADGGRLANGYVLAGLTPPAQSDTPPLSDCAVPPLSDLQGLKYQDEEHETTTTPDGVVDRDDVVSVLQAMIEHVQTATGRAPKPTKAWARDVRLMLDGPGREPPEWTVEQLLHAVRWLDGPTRDAQFWSANVLCPSKLRMRMPRLAAAIRAEKMTPAGSGRAPAQTMTDLAAMAAELNAESAA